MTPSFTSFADSVHAFLGNITWMMNFQCVSTTGSLPIAKFVQCKSFPPFPQKDVHFPQMNTPKQVDKILQIQDIPLKIKNTLRNPNCIYVLSMYTHPVSYPVL